MRKNLNTRSAVLGAASLLALLPFLAGSLAAQTTASGQTAAPRALGSRATPASNCTGADGNTAAAPANDPNCAAGPGFASPAGSLPVPDNGRQVTSLVRIDKIVPRPPVALPEGDSFSVVGSVTILRLRRPALDACLASGKRISMRATAGTSTTCMDHKGEVLAYQECKVAAAGEPDCTVVSDRDIAKQQLNTKPQ